MSFHNASVLKCEIYEEGALFDFAFLCNCCSYFCFGWKKVYEPERSRAQLFLTQGFICSTLNVKCWKLCIQIFYPSCWPMYFVCFEVDHTLLLYLLRHCFTLHKKEEEDLIRRIYSISNSLTDYNWISYTSLALYNILIFSQIWECWCILIEHKCIQGDLKVSINRGLCLPAPLWLSPRGCPFLTWSVTHPVFLNLLINLATVAWCDVLTMFPSKVHRNLTTGSWSSYENDFNMFFFGQRLCEKKHI